MADDARLVVDRREVFDDTYVHARAWAVPTSDRYPEGVKYSFQYGRTESDTGDGTIIRYDNFPDHPGATRHHKHQPDGAVETVDFSGLRPLFQTFKTEVTEEYGEHWD